MAELLISEYQPADRQELDPLFRAHLGGYLSANEGEDITRFLDHLDASISDPSKVRYWVGRSEGRMVMGGGLEFHGDVAYLLWGIALVDEIGKGWGKAMLLHRLAVVRQMPSIGSVFCDTAPRTEGFFLKHGFVTKATQPNFWGGDVDYVGMELSLDGISRFERRLDENGKLNFREKP